MTIAPAAAWWTALEDDHVRCDLCPLRCRLRPGRDAPCGTRANRGGAMTPLEYGRVAAVGLDPVEKKPLYHFRPGSAVFSVAAHGCNLHCAFCQNWTLSQERGGQATETTPEAVVADARRHDTRALAFTYSEPLVWFEFLRDTARLARAEGLAVLAVTNGFLEPGPLAELAPWLDAVNVDLKSMDDRFYRRVCKARLQPVLDAITALHAAGVHVEVTNLLIPDHNDDPAQVDALASFLADLDPGLPLHLSAYHPAWKLDARPTTADDLLAAAAVARRRLDHVYLGNVRLPGESDTRCPRCGHTVIWRDGYAVRSSMTAAGACLRCGRAIGGVWE
ncbi:MAG TPA: AmmeMemoRadiSam system radical SAM enzyme [Candidatus Krumholzibacteria bacterium]|nr:AmmeMemoRadiSam system radical SAM enzyme [Candidatus Krumholzibacteria bacterium]